MANMIRKTLVTGAVVLIGACSSDDAQIADGGAQEAATQATVERFVHEIDMMSVIKRFLSPEGYMDPAFPPTVAKPSPHLTDFYGAQAIQDVTRDDIVADFVPEYAEIESESDHSITLKFKDGFTATFYPVSTLSVMGFNAEVSHVVLSGDTWQSARDNVQSLLDTIAAIGRDDAYLVENTFYDLEKQTYDLMLERQQCCRFGRS